MVATRRLRKGRHGGGSGWVGRTRGGVRGEGCLDDGLDDFVYVHVWRWRRRRDGGAWGAGIMRARTAKMGAEESTGEICYHEGSVEWSRWSGCNVMSVGSGNLCRSWIRRSVACFSGRLGTAASSSARGDGGVIVATVTPQRERDEVDVVVADVPRGGVDGWRTGGSDGPRRRNS